jgi:hypothetical protein
MANKQAEIKALVLTLDRVKILFCCFCAIILLLLPACSTSSPQKKNEAKLPNSSFPPDNTVNTNPEYSAACAAEATSSSGSGFGQNAFIRKLQNEPLTDIPGDIGKVTVAGVSMVVGIPLVFVGQMFYYPFSSEYSYYEGMKYMYYGYYDVVKNDIQYSGYYLLALPFYLVKLIAWDAPIYGYEAICNKPDNRKPAPKTFED